MGDPARNMASMSQLASHRGLRADEVLVQRRTYGPNVLTPPPRAAWWQEYLAKFDDPVIRILMVAAAVAIGVGALDGKVAEGVGIVVAIFLATFLAFWNEHRANRAFDVLNQSSDDVPIKVIRDGTYSTIPRREVVVGDFAFVEVGEEVPADGRLVEAVSLLVNESKLTGEARPATKTASDAPAEGTAYAPGQLLRGTTIADGYGIYTVSAVGDATEIGKTLRESVEATGNESPLKRQLGSLSRVIGVVGFGVAVVVFAALVGRGAIAGTLVLSHGQWAFAAAVLAGGALALARVWWPIVGDGLELLGVAVPSLAWSWPKTLLLGAALGGAFLLLGILLGAIPAEPAAWLPREAGRQLLRNFMIAVTIIVVAVPEGLAMSVTLSLAYSMRKMTAENTLVRRMEACETIGAATVICSDKTGTLTRNEMRVLETTFALEAPPLRTLVVEAMAANTTAHLGRDPLRAVGNPTEGALLLWLDDLGEDYIVARKSFAVATQLTFSTERKFMATLGASPTHGSILHVKGAPDVLLAKCVRVRRADSTEPLTEARRAELAATLQAFQQRGMRTLAFAYRAATEVAVEDLTWLGAVAIADPVRAEVSAAIAACRRAGVAVKIVTGDNAETAREIARQIGLSAPDACLTGAEFAALPDAEASLAAERLQVLARARPADKLRLVSLLKQNGHVVAVTGDGVNDGPALNHADVGLAMGRSGTSVAKEASDIILLDDSFTSIVTAIRWGRALYENIQRFILFQLTINVAALGLAVLGPFVGYELPLTVMQMLWVNLIMDTFAALALATEPPHEGVLQRPPRRTEAFIVSRSMAANLFGVGAVFLAALVGLMAYFADELGEPDVPTRGSTILFTAFVLLQFWNLFNAKCMNRTNSIFASLGNNPSFLLIAAAILVGQVALVQFGGAVFRTVPLALADWGVLLALTSAVLWVGEGVRFAARLRGSGRSEPRA